MAEKLVLDPKLGYPTLPGVGELAFQENDKTRTVGGAFSLTTGDLTIEAQYDQWPPQSVDVSPLDGRNVTTIVEADKPVEDVRAFVMDAVSLVLHDRAQLKTNGEEI